MQLLQSTNIYLVLGDKTNQILSSLNYLNLESTFFDIKIVLIRQINAYTVDLIAPKVHIVHACVKLF